MEILDGVMIAMIKYKVTLHIIQGLHTCAISKVIIAMENKL